MTRTRDVETKTATHKLARTRLPGLPELEFLSRINPLVALHCLADADILITGRESFFGKVGKILNRGYQIATEDLNARVGQKIVQKGYRDASEDLKARVRLKLV